jgi:TM2 domain-containing membrane protein YozV
MPGAAVCTACGCALAAPTAAGNAKSKLAAGLLGIFLGSLGIHNFYLGYTKKAVAQLLIGLLGSCLIVGPMVSGIWGLVEGIQILCGKITVDGKGMPLGE